MTFPINMFDELKRASTRFSGQWNRRISMNLGLPHFHNKRLDIHAFAGIDLAVTSNES